VLSVPLYTYFNLLNDMENYRLYSAPKRMKVDTIGSTYDKRHIYSLRLGSVRANKKYILVGSIHGREYINTYLLIKLAKYFTKSYSLLEENDTALYMIPMANPDGVVISQSGTKALNNYVLSCTVKKMLRSHHTFHSKWKANACGIDLNRNFPTGYQHMGNPGPKLFPGEYAASSKETKSLMAYVESIPDPSAVIHYHSRGNLIYWDYNVPNPLRTRNYQLATLAAVTMNYKYICNTIDTEPNGGFGDWCVYDKGIPSITIENGRFYTPVPHWQFASIYKKNLAFLQELIAEKY
jgi:g-D-glutamyl-meso-diaminopimelate peptidase